MQFRARSAFFCLVFAVCACHKSAAPAPAVSAITLSSSGVSPSAVPASDAPPALAHFEGEIRISAKGKFGKQTPLESTSFTLQVKDGKFRVDLPDSFATASSFGKAYALVSPGEKKLNVVVDAKKQIIAVDLEKFAAQVNALGLVHSYPSTGSSEGVKAHMPPRVSITGTIDTVAGYSCRLLKIEQEHAAVDVCVAEQSAPWFRLSLPGVPPEFDWVSQLVDGEHVPLRFVMSEDGVERDRVEVTSIQKKPVPTEAFIPPANYAVLDWMQVVGEMMLNGGEMSSPDAARPHSLGAHQGASHQEKPCKCLSPLDPRLHKATGAVQGVPAGAQ